MIPTRLVLLFLVFTVAGCLKTSSVCESDADCFGTEACVNSTCSARVVIDDKKPLCDRTSCEGPLTESTICVGPSCVIASCANSAVFCDDGCCPSEPSTDETFDVSSDYIDNVNVVVTAGDQPNIFWYDFDRFTLVHRMWDGGRWRTERPALFPEPSWDFDVTTNGNGDLVILYTGDDSNLVLGRRTDTGGWETSVVHRPDEPALDVDDPAFILPALTMRATTPYGCALFGSDPEFFGDDPNPQRPEVWTFGIGGNGEFVPTKIPLVEPAATHCSIAVDNSGREHLYYSVREPDGLFYLRAAERVGANETWTFNSSVPRIGGPQGRDAVGFGPDGQVRMAYQVVETDGVSADEPVLKEIRLLDGEVVDQSNVDRIIGTGDDITFNRFGYVGQGEDLELIWVRLDVSANDIRVGRATQRANGDYDVDADHIVLPRLPGSVDFDKQDRLHVVSVDPDQKKIDYFVR